MAKANIFACSYGESFHLSPVSARQLRVWVPHSVGERLFLVCLNANSCRILSNLPAASAERIAGFSRVCGCGGARGWVWGLGRLPRRHEAGWPWDALLSTQARFASAARVKGLRGCGFLLGGFCGAGVALVSHAALAGAPFSSPFCARSGRADVGPSLGAGASRQRRVCVQRPLPGRAATVKTRLCSAAAAGPRVSVGTWSRCPDRSHV